MSGQPRTGQPIAWLSGVPRCVTGSIEPDPNIAQEPLQGRALHRPARKTAVVVQSRQDHPAFMLLGEDKGCTGFALGIERVEGLLQAGLIAIEPSSGNASD